MITQDYRLLLIPMVKQYSEDLDNLRNEKVEFIKNKLIHLKKEYKLSDDNASEEISEMQELKYFDLKIRELENNISSLIISI